MGHGEMSPLFSLFLLLGCFITCFTLGLKGSVNLCLVYADNYGRKEKCSVCVGEMDTAEVPMRLLEKIFSAGGSKI